MLGLGGVGSAAAYHLASSRYRVLGLDQYPPAHDQGSSHGKTRIIRQAYFEHPSYVPLLRRAYELWRELELDSGETLFHQTGLVEIGPPDGVVIRGVKQSAAEHGLAISELMMSDVTANWPGLVGHDGWHAVLETNAGFLKVEDCVAAHLRLAVRAGAVCRHRQTVQGWSVTGAGVRIDTDDGVETADRLVIAAGPWIGSLVSGLGVELSVRRKHQYWLAAEQPGYELSDGFPCFFYETPHGYFYGFPSITGSGVKVARHSGGQRVAAPGGTHPVDHSDRQSVSRFVGQCLPGVSDQMIAHAGCYYTMTPDEHFIVDALPGHDQVIVIAGLSGHGFKFTSVLGEIAGQLAIGDKPVHDTTLFQLRRFQSS